MQKITPHLWFDTQAKEAAEFYTSLLPNSKITHSSTLHNTPSGDTDIVSFELAGEPFMAISAGPYFKFNPSISFHIKCSTKEEVDALWAKISEGGQVLMELGSYPFSERYGWCNDKYGLSWQIIYNGDPSTSSAQKITPVMMFVQNNLGKAEEAINFYTSVFKHAPGGGSAEIKMLMKNAAGDPTGAEGQVKYGSFALLGTEFGAMDSAGEHNFQFNEAVSIIVSCDTQGEIDYYWGKLSAVPESEQCGWLKDKFGVSWQITPTAMEEMMQEKDEKKLARVTEAFLKMKKFDIAELKKAAEGE